MLGLVFVTYICMMWFAICTIPFAKACLCKCVKGSCKEWTDGCKESLGLKKKEQTMAEKVGLGGDKKSASGKKVRAWVGGGPWAVGPGRWALGGGPWAVGGVRAWWVGWTWIAPTTKTPDAPTSQGFSAILTS